MQIHISVGEQGGQIDGADRGKTQKFLNWVCGGVILDLLYA